MKGKTAVENFNDTLKLEKSALERKDWRQVEKLAFCLENIAYQLEREHKGIGNIPPEQRKLPADKDCFLLTGAAGFIGSHLARELLKEGHFIVGADEFNDYYDTLNKYENVVDLLENPNFELYEADFRDYNAMKHIMKLYKIDQIVHLGARAGVRPSIQDPQLYVTTNVLGTQNMLELAKEFNVQNFVYASSSSVYGESKEFPFKETQNIDSPVSPYAATKKANEVQAANYSNLYHFPVTGLRFFTVYGPGGRPDMAIRKFAEKMLNGKPIPMYGDGSFERDYTFVDDIVHGIQGAIKASKGKKNWCEVFNLGESDTTNLAQMILMIAKHLNLIQCDSPIRSLSKEESNKYIEELKQKNIIESLPEQLGDVPKTYADISKARRMLGYDPKVKIEEGLRRTVEWHVKKHAESVKPEVKELQDAIRTYSAIKIKAGIDRFNRFKDPAYTEKDILQLASVRDVLLKNIFNVNEPKARDIRVLASAYKVMGDVCAYLGDKKSNIWGLNGLSVRNKRRRMLSLCRESGDRSMSHEEEEELLLLASDILAVTGRRKSAIVVASAGYGTRIADKVGGYEMKHRLFLGDEMIILSLRNMIPYSKEIVAVVSEKNQPDVQTLLNKSEICEENNYKVHYVIQKERLGDGDAHLTANEVLADFDGIILFVFADAPTKTPVTIEKMELVKQALAHLAPLVIPCYPEEKPYSPIIRNPLGPDKGRVIWNWQKADEEEYPEAKSAREQHGLRNVGIFAAEADVFPALLEFKKSAFANAPRYKRWKGAIAKWEDDGSPEDKKPKEPEFGFADLMKVMPMQGFEVVAPAFANRADKLNVNKEEDAEDVRQLYRLYYPYNQVEVEKIPENSEVIVKFVDLDKDKQVIKYNNVPSIRNYTRLLFDKGTNLNSKEVNQRVKAHITTLKEKIEKEIKLTVLAPKEYC